MNKIDCFDGEYGFLSNFYAHPVYHDGILYPTNEHAFQAAKTMDLNKRKEIAALKTPGQAKRAGRHVLLREDWEEVKYQVMKEIVSAKFLDPDLKEKLLATGDTELIEGNTWHDCWWGVCDGVGQNNLGKILMEIRNLLK